MVAAMESHNRSLNLTSIQAATEEDLPPSYKPGSGYSKDIMSFVGVGKGDQCFKVSKTETNKTIFKYSNQDYGMSFSDMDDFLHQEMHDDVPLPFSWEVHSDYKRRMNDSATSLSINYITYQAHIVNVTVDEKFPLTAHGEVMYRLDHKNFGIECGDAFVAEYYEGAMLLYGLKLEFESTYDKQWMVENFNQT